MTHCTHMCMSLAPALKALAVVDVDPNFIFAIPAVNDQPVGFRFWRDLYQPFIAAADRADQESVPYAIQYIRLSLCLQYFRHTFSF